MKKLNWSEFLEWFTRVAYIKFVNSETEGLNLVEKVKHLMNDTFYHCLNGTEVQEPTDDFVWESDDEEYWIN